MANIPVERTGGTPWWLWVLGLLLLGLLVWFLIGALDDDDEIAATAVPVEVVDPVPPSEAGVAMAPLAGLVVTRVVGDRTFYVAPSMDSTDETLVILDQAMSPDVGGIEGQVDINAGQTVDLSGGRREALGDVDVLTLGLPDADANALTPDTEVIRIDGGDVDISDADLENVEVGE